MRLGNNSVLELGGAKGIEHLGCANVAKGNRVDGCRCNVSYAAAHALTSIIQDDLLCVGVILKLSFDDDT